MNISDPRFKYTSAINTDVTSTFKKFGYKPTTEAERKLRQLRQTEEDAKVCDIRTATRRK